MKVKFPVDCTTEASRLSYLYRFQEVLQVEHNIKDEQMRNGDITIPEWQNYLSLTFVPKNETILDELNIAKANAKKGTFWIPDLEKDFE